jgi:TonB family protein
VRDYRTQRRSRAIVFCAALLTSGVLQPVWSQTQSLAPVRVSWPLIDLLLVPDSSAGLRVLASPTPASTAGSGPTVLVQLNLDPILTRQWASLLPGIAANVHSGDSPALRATPALVDLHGGKYLQLVHETARDSSAQELYLIVSDSMDGRRWRVFTTAAAIDTLAQMLERTAQGSQWRSDDSSEIADDRPVELRFVPTLEYPKELRREGRIGRVWAEYVVDPSGRADEHSIRILLSDDPLFTREVYSVLQRTRYRPALRHGRAIARRVQQAFQFRSMAN